MEVVGAGASSIVCLVTPGRVAKLYRLDCQPFGHYEHEQRVYNVLGSHPRILRYLGIWQGKTQEHSLFEYHPRGTLRQVLSSSRDSSSIPADKWAQQFLEGLAYLHSRDVIHGDLSTNNALVTDDDDIVLMDFAGSSLTGQRPSTPSIYGSRNLRPTQNLFICTIMDDLFAFGSVLYELYTRVPPYKEKTDEEVEKLYSQGIFPDVSAIPVGSIVLKCWLGGYEKVAAVLSDLRAAETAVPIGEETKGAFDVCSRSISNLHDS
ncbi:tkl protein kinase [Zalerion maritima]|uniref:non-specific serine/threonine protein kinase n=1 Tax=Zalerion maritima TaxID=339359 RepID=A0AAD5RKB0_9PEZI|nr:tkl protein kinase [Zalerion maritima]